MRTNAEQFFDREQVLRELDDLKFAYASIVDLLPAGSFQRELADNATRGVRARLDYLHDSLSLLFKE